MTESMSEISQEMFSLKKKDKIQKSGEAGKTKSSFATITKRIHEISLQERLLKGSDNGSRTAKHSSSNPPNGRVGPSKPSNSPNGRVGPNMLPSPHSHSILFSDQIELTLFCLDWSHHQNFTVWKPQRTRSLEGNSDFLNKTSTVN
ncbi:hypothetical protein F2Q69_00052913 [Brassica cretica]|uniref:Uncharacterized protein n=1 Tax=Brassica cretica TaxID=69181 RepID=A0A8S9N5G6_BRACR|nr:hypothetical protein F2Q69_00052913 [Brassica cretica]